ncbi:DUF6119 family protein [Sinorhizobium arboris]|uniref:DUF6119 family protein n=1 Tax=Sinorhizobium arboris TaxID=76745 RepID=UPI00124334D2|nr:DUF6119 family protein [Sinorhizobium arboris]
METLFGIEKNLTQVNKGALVFLPVGDRHFALSFGHVAHNLIDSSYEHDIRTASIQTSSKAPIPRAAKRHGCSGNVIFIADQVVATQGREKKRKKEEAAVEVQPAAVETAE